MAVTPCDLSWYRQQHGPQMIEMPRCILMETESGSLLLDYGEGTLSQVVTVRLMDRDKVDYVGWKAYTLN